MIDVLAIAAHPDDVEQTCGGTLLRMAEAGYSTGIIDMTAGDMGTRGSPEIRVEESEAAAKILGVTHRENLHFPDARLENSMAGRMTVAHRIRELRPKTVILPYWTGRHPDHYRASEIGYEACFLAGLRKIDQYTEPHRPHKIIYSSIYANVTPSFVLDIPATSKSEWNPSSPITPSTDPSKRAQRFFPMKRKSVSASPPSRASMET